MALLRQYGATPYCLPCIAINPVDNLSDQQIDASLACDLLIFTSTNAVEFLLQRRPAPWNVDAANPRIAAIGTATASYLSAHSITVDLLPAKAKGSEQLLDLLQQTELIVNKRITIVRGNSGREKLRNDLSMAGAAVRYLEVYQRSLPQISPQTAKLTFEKAAPDIISITSDLGLKNLCHLLPADSHQTLFSTPLVVNSERCRTLASRLGFSAQLTVANPPGDTSQAEAIRSLFQQCS